MGASQHSGANTPKWQEKALKISTENINDNINQYADMMRAESRAQAGSKRQSLANNLLSDQK
jgi:hypothetical protein